MNGYEYFPVCVRATQQKPDGTPHTFSRWQHNLLVGVDVAQAAGVEALQLAFEVRRHLWQVLKGGSVAH